MKANKQQGFTIIELVVVILLLGILTATALPRFMDVTDEAHQAVVEGIIGGIASGTGMYRAQWVGEGQPGVGTAVAGFGAGDLMPNLNGYPVGVDTTLDTSSDCASIYRGLLQSGGRPSITSIAAGGAIAATDITTAVSTQDIVAYLDNVTSASNGICNFAYVRQYTNGASATGADVPVIQLNELGEITTTTL